jgi:general secretion pathway protein J
MVFAQGRGVRAKARRREGIEACNGLCEISGSAVRSLASPRQSPSCLRPFARTPFLQNGFTLVELIVALAIFGLISAAGVGLLGTSVRSQEAVGAKLDTLAAGQKLGSLMATDMAQALPRITRNAEGAPRRAFTVNENGVLIGLVRAAGATGGEGLRPGVQRIEWRFVRGRLRRAVSPMPDGAVIGEGSLIADNLESVALRVRDKGEWRDRWDALRPDAMPQAVELVLTPRGGAPVRRLFLVGPGQPEPVALDPVPAP